MRIGDFRVLTTLLTAFAVWLFVIFTGLATTTLLRHRVVRSSGLYPSAAHFNSSDRMR